MIEVKREGSKIIVAVDTDLPHPNGPKVTTTYHFSQDFGDIQRAELGRRYFRERLEALAKRIRREAYLAGHRDGRRHVAKETKWFDGGL